MDNSRYKFRAWDKEYEKMTITYTLDELLANAHPFHRVFQGDYIWMQFTGLTDSEGKELYDGDVFEWFKEKWQVDYGGDGSFWVLSGPKMIRLHKVFMDEIKIIGNIYEKKDEVSNDTK